MFGIIVGRIHFCKMLNYSDGLSVERNCKKSFFNSNSPQIAWVDLTATYYCHNFVVNLSGRVLMVMTHLGLAMIESRRKSYFSPLDKAKMGLKSWIPLPVCCTRLFFNLLR